MARVLPKLDLKDSKVSQVRGSFGNLAILALPLITYPGNGLGVISVQG